MSSEAKIEANRRNALKSTGPRTKCGKSKSRLNAVTHGLNATTPVLRGEDERAYRELAQAYLEQFSPVGLVENLLVRQITAEDWRLRRFDKAEVALGRKVQRDKAARLFELLDKKATSFAQPLLSSDVVEGDDGTSPVAHNYLASLATLRGLHWAKVKVSELTPADKKFIIGKIADVLNIGSTILESLVPADDSAPQERLDRQRHKALNVYLGLVAKLMEFQKARLTETLIPELAAEDGSAQKPHARCSELLPPRCAANQNHRDQHNGGPEEVSRDISAEPDVRNGPGG